MKYRLVFDYPQKFNFKNEKETRNYGEWKFYLWWLSNWSRRHTTVKRSSVVLNVLDIKPNSRVLDEGCGWGYLVMLFAQLGHRAAGIDLDREQLDVARELAEYNRIPADFLYMDAKQTNFAEGEFDIVIQMEALEHMGDDWNRSIKDISRILKEGGQLVLSTPNTRGIAQIVKSFLTRFKYFLKFWTKEEFIPAKLIEKELQENGLKVIAKKRILLAIPFIPNFLFPVNLLLEIIVENVPILNEIATTYLFYCLKESK
ncbi:MAG: methyltransferase domain-containing protein [Candidatus Omnitrophota bacterium]|jgi:2-polyprenyl-3-methyl-5-hydroxy-6-metoxy-1,4-benzoquinol methylase